MTCVRIRTVGLATAIAGLLAVSTARADGLPVLGIDAGGTGIAAPSGRSHYVTIPAGSSTVVARVAISTGDVLLSGVVPGIFTIPAVAYDGSPGGLSHDGRSLVLIEPRKAFPRRDTTFALLDARTLRVRRVVHLRGDFSLDAVSPAGAWIYFIQYISPRDATRYLVRAFDTRTGQLAAAPILDPNAPGEKMRGNPLSRATSANGRWAYTLYDGAGGTPFVHALDTIRHTARCIDLSGLAGRTDLWSLRLRVDSAGGRLDAMRGHSSVALVDLRTFAVRDHPSSGEDAVSIIKRHVPLLALGTGATSAAVFGALLLWRRSRKALVLTRAVPGRR